MVAQLFDSMDIKLDDDDVEQDIISRFKSLVKEYPNNIAIDDYQQKITYAELDEKSTVLAKLIVKQATGSSPWVCLFFERDVDTIIAMFATAKAGKGWVCLDPSMPKSRLDYIVEDASASAIITSDSTLKSGEIVSDSAPVINIDASPIDTDDIELPQPTAHSYICLLYTSGSSGKPKGVIHSHRNLLHVVRKSTNSFCITESDNIAMISPLGHVVGLAAAMMALMNGASLMPFKLSQSGFVEFAEWIEKKQISYFHVVPSVYRRLLDAISDKFDYSKLRVIAIGGEQVTEDDINRIPQTFSHDIVLRNAYGCTEAIDSCQKIYSFEDHSDAQTVVAIGQPMAPFEEVKLLQEGGELDDELPEGASGEILVSSDYLAIGYWNKDSQTAEKFITSDKTGKRYYRTGDLAKYNNNQDLIYVGRGDNQVKVNGYRIELEEIEAKVYDIEEIKEAAVIFNPEEESILVYYVLNTAKDINVREELAKSLPSYMLPHDYFKLDKLPQLHNGKVDRVSLLEMASADTSYAYQNKWIAKEIKADTIENTKPVIVFEAAINKQWSLPETQDISYLYKTSTDELGESNSDTYIYSTVEADTNEPFAFSVDKLKKLEEFITFIKEINQTRGHQTTTLLVPFLTTGSDKHEFTDLNDAVLAGLCQSIPRELPSFRIKLIGFDKASFANQDLWKQIIASPQSLESLTVFKDNQAYVRRLTKAPEATNPTNLDIKPNASYLITGGLGGFGLSLAQLLVESGTKQLILLDRSSPMSEAKATIAKLQELGCDVSVKQCDITNTEQVHTVFAEIKTANMPLAGVIHAAGTNDFDLIQNKAWSRFNQVLAPKVNGAWNLHLETQEMALDFFVMTSSITAEFGFIGHADYSAANSFLNALAQMRQSMKLPALSINFGAIAVGMSEANDIQMLIKQEGIGILSINSATSELVNALQLNNSTSYSINADWNKIYSIQNGIGKGEYLSELADVSASSKQASSDKKDPSTYSEEDLINAITEIWKEILKKSDFDINDNFFDVGGDSLALLSLHLSLTTQFSTNVSVANLLDEPSIKNMSKLLSNNDSHAKVSSVVKNVDDPSLPLMFMINSTGVARALHNELKSHMNIYSLNMFNLSSLFEGKLDNDEPVSPRLAKLMADDIVETQPDGAIKLLGFCQDGVLTIEIIKELRDLNREVDFVGLFDVSFHVRLNRSFKTKILISLDLGLEYFFGKIVRELIERTWNRIITLIKKPFAHLFSVKDSPEEATAPQSTIDELLYAEFFEEAFSRIPRPIDTKLNLFVSREWKFEDYSDVIAITPKEVKITPFQNAHLGYFSEKNISKTAQHVFEIMKNDKNCQI